MKKKSSSNDADSIRKNRPLSPHLTIYSLQLTSGLSILHRITGAYLYLGLALLAWIIFGLVYLPETAKEIGQFIFANKLTAILAKLMLLTWTFSLFYHQLNGLRHLFWDAGKGFDLKTAYRSGWLVFGLSIFLTIISWLLAFIGMGGYCD